MTIVTCHCGCVAPHISSYPGPSGPGGLGRMLPRTVTHIHNMFLLTNCVGFYSSNMLLICHLVSWAWTRSSATSGTLFALWFCYTTGISRQSSLPILFPGQSHAMQQGLIRIDTKKFTLLQIICSGVPNAWSVLPPMPPQLREVTHFELVVITMVTGSLHEVYRSSVSKNKDTEYEYEVCVCWNSGYAFLYHNYGVNLYMGCVQVLTFFCIGYLLSGNCVCVRLQWGEWSANFFVCT